MYKTTFVILTVFLSVSACGIVEDLIADKIAEEVTEGVAEEVIEQAIEDEQGGKADVDLSEGKLSVKTDKGNVKIDANGAEIPNNFPKDVYVPKDAKVLMAMELPEGMNVTLETKQPAKDLVAQFVKESEGNGWVQKSKMDAGQAQIIAYEKEGRILNISITNDEANDKRMIMLNVSNAKK